MKKRAAIGILVVFGLCAAAAQAAVTPQEAWEKIEEKIGNADDLKATIGFFSYYPDTLRKYYPEAEEELKYNVGGWRYQKLEYAWKRPDRIFVKFLAGRNLGNDIALRVVQQNPGTLLSYGYRGRDFIHVRFPVTKETKALFPNVARTIFSMPSDSKRYSSAISKMGYDTTPGDILLEHAKYLKTGTVAMEKGTLKLKENFSVKDGKVKYDETAMSGGYYVMTMKPRDVEKNRGIGREIVYLESATLMPVQIEMYHGDALAACMTITDLKINAGLKDQLWEDFYKDGEIVEAPASGAPPKPAKSKSSK